MIGDNLQQYTYEYLMELALSLVPDDRDKRQGSIIYDALAPFCQLIAAGAQQLRNYYTQTYAVTAVGEDLDNRVIEQGISRYAATNAIKLITFADQSGNPIAVPLGARFSTVSDTSPINYTITAQYLKNGNPVAGAYEATCEEVGTIGNEYSGNMINITFIQGLASSTMSTVLVPARDEETDEELRKRYFESLNQKAFGGNVADYRLKVVEDLKAGAVQVYPTWDGGGTVKLSIVDTEYAPCSTEFVARVQQEIDPGSSGTGIGIAPIGHRVTVATPEEVEISVSANITLDADYQLGQVETAIKDTLAEYIQSLRASWADTNALNIYSCNVYIARVTAAIITVPGIANVSEVRLNGSTQDILLTQTGLVQQLPKLGEVTLNV